MNIHGEKCGLYFKTFQELIYHIEEEHIPLIENSKMAERKQITEQFAKDPEQREKAYTAFINQAVPLSLICRLKPLPKGHKIQPIAPPKPRTMKFCHYKLKQPTVSQQQCPPSFVDSNQNLGISDLDTNRQQQIFSSNKLISLDNQSRLRQTSTSSESTQTPELNSALEQQALALGQEERKFFCQVENCGKTYKNHQGLRTHLRNAHNIEGSMQLIATKLSASEESILSRQLPGRQSPFISVSTEQISNKQQNSPIRNILPTSYRHNETKYLCPHCTKGYKTMSYLNRHILETHPAASSTNPQQIFSTQQSPQKSISVTNMISVIPATKADCITHTQDSFVVPTLNARTYQTAMPSHQITRPSAPIPPSTPPSGSSNIISSQPIEFSPQTPQHPQSISIIHNQQDMQHPQRIMTTAIVVDQQHEKGQNTQMIGQQQHYYVTTHPSNQQQQPIIQQQPMNAQRYRYSYQQQQPHQTFVQRQQQEQPIYSSGINYSSYPANHLGNQQQQQTNCGTTIYVNQQGNVGITPVQQHYAIQQPMELDHTHGNYPRAYYRHQNNYMVEPIQSGSGYTQQTSQPQPSNNRLTSVPSTIRLSSGNNNSSQYVQQQTMQQTQQFATTYRSGTDFYQGETSSQQPYMTLRTASIQAPHRIYHQQQSAHQQFYTQQSRTHFANNSNQRQSPATVAAVLAGDNTPNTYGSQNFGGGLL